MQFTERVWRHCMVLFTCGHRLNDRPVEDYITREGRYIQELLEKCENRYHVLNCFNFGDPAPITELFQKITYLITRNKRGFTTKEKQRKLQIFPWQKTLTEEEWDRREQQLIERVMKALEEEPEKQTVPSVRIAQSKDEGLIPDSEFIQLNFWVYSYSQSYIFLMTLFFCFSEWRCCLRIREHFRIQDPTSSWPRL